MNMEKLERWFRVCCHLQLLVAPVIGSFFCLFLTKLLLAPTCLSSTGASCVTAFAVEDWKLEMFVVFVLEIEN